MLFRGTLLAFALSGLVRAAPLPSELSLPARDALARLCAAGLLEGYPDGALKGDRPLTRWEAALIVARLLARPSRPGALATERDALKLLAAELREQLAALNAKALSLEEVIPRLEGRLEERERIQFYGRIEARTVSQSFQNLGAGDNDSLRAGAGTRGRVPYFDYNAVVGSTTLGNGRPQIQGVVPTVDYRNGRALMSGVGFTSLAVLGMKTLVHPDWEAGLELAAFSSQGNNVVDAYWGLSAPYLLNPFTATAEGGPQSQNHSPYTSMVLDRAWLEHKKSRTRLVLGSFERLRMSPLVYAGQTNNNVNPPSRFLGFGFNLSGNLELSPKGSLQWELLGSRLGNGVNYMNTDYQTYVLGADVDYQFPAGHLQANFARMTELPPSQLPAVAGLTSGLNVPYGAASTWTVRQWVNPPGYYVHQIAVPNSVVQGVYQPNVSDGRPVPGWNWDRDNAAGITSGAGVFGPQGQDTFGLAGSYTFFPGLQVNGEWANSRYQSNKKSSYTSNGQALRVDLTGKLFDDSLTLILAYTSIDPTFSPALWNNQLFGTRFVRYNRFAGAFNLFDNTRYPHNRQGFQLRSQWNFDAKNGNFWTRVAKWRQTRTSLYDVRYAAGSLAPNTPNVPVLGYSPGFTDQVFSGLASPLLYGAGSANSFTPTLQPLEDPRGREDTYTIGVSHRWPEAAVNVSLEYERIDFNRPTSLEPALGGSQNAVRLSTQYWNLGVLWQPQPDWDFSAGYEYVSYTGHFDPAGLYNGYANSTGLTTFDNLDSRQHIPYLGFQHRLNEKSEFGATLRHYHTLDLVHPGIQPANGATVGSSAHPFSWQGWQLISNYSLKF